MSKRYLAGSNEEMSTVVEAPFKTSSAMAKPVAGEFNMPQHE